MMKRMVAAPQFTFRPPPCLDLRVPRILSPSFLSVAASTLPKSMSDHFLPFALRKLQANTSPRPKPGPEVDLAVKSFPLEAKQTESERNIKAEEVPQGFGNANVKSTRPTKTVNVNDSRNKPLYETKSLRAKEQTFFKTVGHSLLNEMEKQSDCTVELKSEPKCDQHQRKGSANMDSGREGGYVFGRSKSSPKLTRVKKESRPQTVATPTTVTRTSTAEKVSRGALIPMEEYTVRASSPDEVYANIMQVTRHFSTKNGDGKMLGIGVEVGSDNRKDDSPDRLLRSKRSKTKSKTRMKLKPKSAKSDNQLQLKLQLSSEPEKEVSVQYVELKCAKCQQLKGKLKSLTLRAKNLQAQNGCLESIITQKRNLVERLTKQVRGLLKQNFQLSKGSGLIPLKSAAAGTDGTNLCAVSKSEIGNRHQDTNRDVEIEMQDLTQAPPMRNANYKVTQPMNSANADLVRHVEHLQAEIRNLELKSCEIRTEHQSLQRFMSDLLYTLNARGYDCIIDHDGRGIDLMHCRGEHLLDLRERDLRIWAPARKTYPQEAYLKAVIGSQEGLIQDLVNKVNEIDRQVKPVLGRNEQDSTNESAPRSNSLLQSEVLASLCSIIEGACKRSPDCFQSLKDQYVDDVNAKANYGQKNTVIEELMDRCENSLCWPIPPPSPIETYSEGVYARGSTPIPIPSPRTRKSNSPRSRPSTGIRNYPPSTTQRPPSRFSSQSPTTTATAFRPPPRPSTTIGLGVQSDVNMHASSNAKKGSNSKCLYCGLRFGPDATATDLESHFRLHTKL